MRLVVFVVVSADRTQKAQVQGFTGREILVRKRGEHMKCAMKCDSQKEE